MCVCVGGGGVRHVCVWGACVRCVFSVGGGAFSGFMAGHPPA